MRTLSVSLFTLILLLCGCTRADYTRVIPEKTEAILKVNLTKAPATLLQHLPKDVISSKAIDPLHPIYLFAFGDYYAAVAKSDKSADIEQLFSGLKTTAQNEEGGYHWTLIENRWLLASDDELLFLAGPTNTANLRTLKRQMLARLNEDVQTPFSETEHGQLLDAADSPASFVMQVSLLPQVAQTPLLMFVPDGITANDLTLVGNLDLEGRPCPTLSLSLSGRTEQSIQLLSTTQLPQKVSITTTENIENDILSLSAWVCDGNHLLKELKKNEALRTVLFTANMAIDADAMLRSIEGPMTLRWQGMAQGCPVFRLEANLKDARFLDESSYWMTEAQKVPDLQLHQSSATDFELKTTQVHLYFGTNPERTQLYMYSVTDRAQSQSVQPQGHNAPSLLTASLNLKRLNEVLPTSIPLVGESLKQFSENYATLTLTTTDGQNFTMQLKP